MKIERKWAMPNKNTFSIAPIKNKIYEYIKEDYITIDPFANSNKIAKITNDIDTEYDTDYHLDALDFLKMFDDSSCDVVLYDPPYSPRQVSESYKKLGMSVNMETTQASYWSKQKDEIKRILKDDGICISFGWNTNGIGKTRGFEIIEILIIAHGGNHNDTLCVVERKIKDE